MSSIQMKLKNNVCLRKTENLKQQMCFLACHALHKPQGPRKRTRRFIATGLWLHLRKLNLFIWMQCFQWKKGFFTHSGDFFTLWLFMLENVSVIQAEEKKTCLQHGKNLEGIEIVQWLQAESRNRKKHI